MQTRVLRFCLELSLTRRSLKDSDCIEAVPLCHRCLLLILLLLRSITSAKKLMLVNG